MLIKDGNQLFKMSEKRFYKWLEHRLNGGLDEIEDHGAQWINTVAVDLTNIELTSARALLKTYKEREKL